MLAQNDDVMTDAVSTIYDITQDSILKQQIRTREEWIAVERRFIEEKEAAEAKSAQIEEEMARSRLEWDAAERRLTDEKTAAEAKSAELAEAIDAAHVTIDSQQQQIAELQELVQQLQSQSQEDVCSPSPKISKRLPKEPFVFLIQSRMLKTILFPNNISINTPLCFNIVP